MRKRCKNCGCYLDPGEWCDCDERQEPERELVKRPVARNPTIAPREYNTEAYIRQKWREFDMR